MIQIQKCFLFYYKLYFRTGGYIVMEYCTVRLRLSWCHHLKSSQAVTVTIPNTPESRTTKQTTETRIT